MSQIQGMVISTRPTKYDSAKRIALCLTNNEIRKGTMVAKDDPPKPGNNKCKSGGEYKRN